MVQHHNKVPMIPLADLLVYVYTFSSLIYFFPDQHYSPPPRHKKKHSYYPLTLANALKMT